MPKKPLQLDGPKSLDNIHFHFQEKTINALGWEEYEALERAQDGDLKLYLMRPLLARFMVDDKNVPLDHGFAMQLIGKLNVSQAKEVVELFIASLKERTVPKGNGNSSQQPLEPKTPPDSEFPDGSAS